MDKCQGLIRAKRGSRYVLVQYSAWKSSIASSTGFLGGKGKTVVSQSRNLRMDVAHLF
jgi:hypothetical protein